jgi:hypothetical protein
MIRNQPGTLSRQHGAQCIDSQWLNWFYAAKLGVGASPFRVKLAYCISPLSRWLPVSICYTSHAIGLLNLLLVVYKIHIIIALYIT